MVRVSRLRCRCKTKTAVVPAWGLDDWRGALRISLNGDSAVVPNWRYLGVYPAATTFRAGVVPGRQRWDEEATRVVIDRARGRPICKIEGRVRVLRLCPGSAGFRAKAWNTYMVSCVPYPAQLCLPDAGGAARLNNCLRQWA